MHKNFRTSFRNRLQRSLWAGVAVILLGGCASVPQESVELSYLLGSDIEALHQSHKQLVRAYFDSLRAQVNEAIDRTYVPAYIAGFVKKGELVEHAKAGRADIVEFWARTAVETIEKQRKTQLEPINAAETELLATVDEAFDRALRANAAITAHLSSVRKVADAQDELLASLQLKELRDKIDVGVRDASKKAKAITDALDGTAAGVKAVDAAINP